MAVNTIDDIKLDGSMSVQQVAGALLKAELPEDARVYSEFQNLQEWLLSPLAIRTKEGRISATEKNMLSLKEALQYLHENGKFNSLDDKNARVMSSSLRILASICREWKIRQEIDKLDINPDRVDITNPAAKLGQDLIKGMEFSDTTRDELRNSGTEIFYAQQQAIDFLEKVQPVCRYLCAQLKIPAREPRTNFWLK